MTHAELVARDAAGETLDWMRTIAGLLSPAPAKGRTPDRAAGVAPR